MTGNLPLKAIAILLALIVWVYVGSGDKYTDKLITIPLHVVEPPEGLAIITGLPDEVELYIRGPQSRVKTVETAKEEGDLFARLNLRHAVEGKKSYPMHVMGANLRWMYYNLHPGPKLEVDCEKSSDKTFIPQRVIIGDVEPGTSIESESGLPEEVTATGAGVLVNQIGKVIYKLTEAELMSSDPVTAVFIPQDDNGRQIPNIKISPPQAELSISLRKGSASREVPVVYNLVGHPPSGYAVTDVNIDPLFINLEGPSELLKGITRIETVAVDLTGHSKDFSIPDLGIIIPKEKVKLSRSTVYLEVKIAHKMASRLFEGLNLAWEGADEQNLFYTSEPRTVNVTVTGPMDAVEGITREMIVPSVDVTGLTEGWHENLPVSVRILLPDITLLKLEPDTVKVHIQKRQETPPAKEGE